MKIIVASVFQKKNILRLKTRVILPLLLCVCLCQTACLLWCRILLCFIKHSMKTLSLSHYFAFAFHIFRRRYKRSFFKGSVQKLIQVTRTVNSLSESEGILLKRVFRRRMQNICISSSNDFVWKIFNNELNYGFKILHNQQQFEIHRPGHNFSKVKCRKMQFTGFVARVGKTRNPCEMLVWITVQKVHLRSLRSTIT
jgi:hypothetical protein